MKEAELLTLFLIVLLSNAVTTMEAGKDFLTAFIFKNMRAIYKKMLNHTAFLF